MAEVQDAPTIAGELEEYVPDEQSPNGEMPMGVPARVRDRAAIVGFADGHRDEAPSDANEFEIWGLNRLFVVMERPWARWVDIHDLAFTYGDSAPGGRDDHHGSRQPEPRQQKSPLKR